MKKPTSDQIGRFILFAFPSFGTLALMFIVLVIWRGDFLKSDMLPVLLVTIAIITAAVLLMKRQIWVCLPMIVLGIRIALLDDQFIGPLFRFYGIYLIVHYAVCGVILHRCLRKGGEK